MQNSIETRGNLCTEAGPPVEILMIQSALHYSAYNITIDEKITALLNS